MRDRSLLLLSLSGVRIHNPELSRLGLTLPGFVDRGRVIASLPSLSLLILAALTPPPWQVELLDLDTITPADVAHIRAARPDLVAITALTARILDAYHLADQLRADGIRVVLGGLHVSALPDEAALHADAVVQGEAEELWPELLRDFVAGRLQPRYSSLFPEPRSVPPNHMPIPRYDLLDRDRYQRITLQTVRGCPLHCSFCAASRTISPWKRKTIPQIRAELESIVTLWPHPFLELADDNTFVNKDWSRALARLLREFHVKWFTETDLSVADDEVLLDLLAESQCAQLLIGLESSHPESLHGLDAGDWKYRQFDHYREKIHTIQAHGISVNGCFVLGLDQDDAAVFPRTLEFIRSSGLAEVQLTVLTPFPGTDLRRQLAHENRLLPNAGWDRCTLFDVMYQPARMSVGELERGFRDLMRDVYAAPEVAARRRAFAGCLRRARRGVRPPPPADPARGPQVEEDP